MRAGKTKSGKAKAEEKVEAAKVEVPAPKDLAEARKNITDLVRASSGDIAQAVIDAAKEGKLAQAKYLFEVLGLYPPAAERSSKPEDSLAYRLLTAMGLPTERVVAEDDGPMGIGRQGEGKNSASEEHTVK